MSKHHRAPTELDFGRIGKVSIDAIAGSGGAGWVLRGRAGERDVGVKVARDAGSEILHREAIARSLLGAPGRPLDAGLVAWPDGAHLALVFEWVEGEPFDALIARLANDDSWGLEARATIVERVGCDVAGALARLHAAGFRHGDVKPENIVVRGLVASDPTATHARATLIDLSLAAPFGTEFQGGTPSHLAPEVLGGGADAMGAASDVFALGRVVAAARAQLGLHTPVGAWLAATSAQPGDRPTAASLADWGRAGRPIDAGYVLARRETIEREARAGSRPRAGVAAPWIDGLCAALHGLSGPTAMNDASTLAPMRDDERARLLGWVAGADAAHWRLPARLADEEALLSAMIEAQRRGSLLSAADLVADHASTATALADAVARVARELDDDDAIAALVRAASAHAKGVATRSTTIDDVEQTAVTMLRRSGEFVAGLALAEALISRLESSSGGVPSALRIEAAELARAAGRRALAEQLVARAALDDGADAHACDREALRARLAFDQGDRARAEAIVATARAKGADSPSLAEIAGLLAWSRGAWREGRTTLQRAIVSASGANAERRARLLLVLGMLFHGDSEPLEALRAFQQAGDLALAIRSSAIEASARSNAAAAGHDAGRWSQAIASSDRAIALLERAGRTRDLPQTRLTRAACWLGIGHRAEALAEIERTLDAARIAENPRAEAYAHWLGIEAELAFEPLSQVRKTATSQRAAAARTALGPTPTAEDALFADAFEVLGGDALSSIDVAAADGSARRLFGSSAAWTWWRARLRVGAEDSSAASIEILDSVLRAHDGSVAPTVTGPTLAEAAAFARRIGRGEAAQALIERLRRLIDRVTDAVPDEHRAAFDGLAWVVTAREAVGGAKDRSDALDLSSGQIELLASISRGLCDRSSMHDLLRTVVDGLVLWVGVERGLLLLRAPSPEGSTGEPRLVPRIARGLAREDLAGEQLALSTRLARRALRTMEPVVAIDALTELADGEVETSIHALRLRSVLAVPLIARGEVLGVVYLDDRIRRGAFGPREVAWVKLLATQAATVIADERDALQLRRLARRAERAQNRLEEHLAKTEGDLAVARAELARTSTSDASGDPRGTRHRYREIIGDGPSVRRMLALLDRVADAADARIPVLIQGESGTGKELVARAIHANGPRKARPFVAENCGAIPETLLETTLFGHVRGAFTGADRPRAGLFELANGGTLFLDEIGEMSLPMQAKLLRALQEGEIRPVGGTKNLKVDVRVIGATHRNLETMVREKTFREDLFYRIAVITVAVPALRERPEDVPQLVTHLIHRFAPEREIRVTRRALAALAAARWPGNIRQLENELRRALIVCDGALDLEHLSSDLVRTSMGASALAGSNSDAVGGDPTLRAQVDALEARLVSEALRRANGNQTKAAVALGLSRFGLQKMLKRLGVQSRAGDDSLA